MRLLDCSFPLLEEEVLRLGLKKYLARQIFHWLYGKLVLDIAAWSSISLANRRLLGQHFELPGAEVVKRESDEQGTTKYLLRLADGELIESVSIAEKDHHTLCLSSQAGCALGCLFCATGHMGFRRDLTAGEILFQAIVMRQALADPHRRVNLVFMGMGEPLLNYGNVRAALQVITDPKGMAIAPRHVTISTVGLVELLPVLERDFPLIKIALSLNAASQALRARIMPIADKEKLADCLAYFRGQRRRHRLTIAYVLIHGVNDSLRAARDLARLLRGIPVKINLIPCNEHPHSSFRAPAAVQVERFRALLLENGYTANIRWSKGTAIASACGQLATEC
jgi:23S rRNA (adenine2503-C2)-methyltransferase